MKRGKTFLWIPLWVDKWLWGSTRHELAHDERAIFTDLLALAAKDDGWIRANPETPYPIEQLSGMLCAPVELVKRALAVCVKFEKLEEPIPGIYRVASWEGYQLTDRRKRDLEDTKPKSQSPSRFEKCPKEFSSMAMASGQVRYSRLVAAMAIGRPLTSEEEVHHINDEDDDSPENLMLFSCHRDHLRFQNGYLVSPLWDGSKMNSADKSALGAALAARLYSSIVSSKSSSLNTKEKVSPHPDDLRLVQLLIELMGGNNPNSTTLKNLTPTRQAAWIRECRLLREKDGKSVGDIEAVIRFSQADEFWKSNILSMGKLREKWDRLWLKAKKADPHAGIKEWLADQERKDAGK
jgi:hypothetical protein